MDKKTIPIQPLRSDNITQGKSRAPNRSMYYGMGYKETDFGKPMVGVANGHSTITPCNSGLQKLADAAVQGIEEAGGNPQIFGTPTISDGMAMGTEGMKYSLVSREVIADCIETCVQGQWMDGVVVIGGCVMCRRRAARPKCSSSATATNWRHSRSSTRGSLICRAY